MNREQVKKTVGHWVRLRPIAHRLDARGRPLRVLDDEWQVERVSAEGVYLVLHRTGHGRLLRFDQVSEYMSDRVEGGKTYAFLVLKVQLTLQGPDVHVEPTRPGVRVSPPMPPDPLRLALLQRLNDFPGRHVPAGELPGFVFSDVMDEIVRCHHEGLLEARVLPSGQGPVDAVALHLKPRGAEWLRQQY